MGRATRKVNVFVQVLLMLGILAVINFLAYRYFTRVDFTADREYTLAPASRTILEELGDVVSINVYFSKNIPPYLTTLKNQIDDLLDEYSAYAGNNLLVRYISPDDDPATQQQMRMMGIPQVQVNILEKDKFQVTQVYMGMAILFEDKKEVLPVVQGVDQLEYILSSAILKVTRETPIKVAMTWPEESLGPSGQGPYSLAASEIARQYDFVPYSFREDRPVPEDVGTLVVAGPRDLDDLDLFHLDQFVARGGKLFLLVDGIGMAGGALETFPVEHNLDRLLSGWGVEIPREMVVDNRFNASASFSSGFMRFRVNYPFWPKILPEGMDAEHPVVNRLESMVMPWTSPVRVQGEGISGVTATALAQSSPQSWLEGEPFDLNPTQRIREPRGETGSSTAVLLLTGAFRSAFAGGDLPEGLDEAEGEALISESPETSVLIVGNSRFAQDDFLGQFPENGIFFMNTLDWMASGASLIGIRSRGATDRPIDELSRRAIAAVRYVNILGVAGLMILIGLIRWYMRRKVSVRGY